MILELTRATALHMTEGLLGLSSIVWGLEMVVANGSHGVADILSWEVGRLRFVLIPNSILASAFDMMFQSRAAMALAFTKTILGCILIFSDNTNVLAGSLIASGGISALWFLRNPLGQDGSDQLYMVLSISLGMALVSNTDASINIWCLFVACQLTICYLTAGLTKLFSLEWRNGQAALLVFRTLTYGSRSLHRLLLLHGLNGKALSWSVILFEVVFPFVFVLPLKSAVALLLIPLIFHFLTSITMGLNLFFLNFAAAYPALVLLIESGPWQLILRMTHSLLADLHSIGPAA